MLDSDHQTSPSPGGARPSRGSAKSFPKSKSATKKPRIPKKKKVPQYTTEECKSIKNRILDAMNHGRSFNGAVALCRRWAKGLEVVDGWGEWSNKEHVPDRATVYRWLKDKEFQEDVEATGENNYGFFEEVAKRVAHGGAVITEDISYYKGQKDGETGPIKKISKTFTPPNPQATLKGLARQAGHLRKIARKEGEERKAAIIEVPDPAIATVVDDEGNEIPLTGQTVFLVQPVAVPKKKEDTDED